MRRLILLSSLAIVLTLVAGGTSEAGSTVLIVDSAASSGQGTLRTAIEAANANPGLDVIQFDPAVFPPGNPTTIFLTDELPDMDASEGITIDGSGAGVTIDGSGAGSLDEGLAFGPFDQPWQNITLRNFTIQNFGDENIEISSLSSLNGLTISGVRSINSGDEGIEVATSSLADALFEDLFITGSHFETLEITPSGELTNVQVLNGEFISSADDGIQLSGSSISNVEVRGNTITDPEDEGISVSGTGQISDVLVSGNTVTGGEDEAVQISAFGGVMFRGVVVENNFFSGNGTTGYPTIALYGPTNGQSFIRSNVVTDGGGAGIAVTGDARQVTISRNSTSNNEGFGIDLGNDGVTPNDPGDGDAGANDLLNFPEWSVQLGAGTAEGTACASCLVEVFQADEDEAGNGEGEMFLGEVFADGAGNFSFVICGVSDGNWITASATDAEGNTSEFSENYFVYEDAPPCLPDNGDVDCDGDVDARDALAIGVDASGATPLEQEDGCPGIGDNLTLAASGLTGPSVFGDVNCSGDVDGADMVAILRHVADIAVDQPAGCAAIGEPIAEPEIGS